MRVLILGGYGVFGGRLARLLAAEEGIEVLVAGRSLARAEAFTAEWGGRPATLDRDGPALAEALGSLAPDIVVDAAGPFQAYGPRPYRLARAALAVGAHYLDLSDDGVFTAGIGSLDEEARATGRAAVSGASSVPALSSAAADALAGGLVEVGLIESAILPGNRAPRGHSVMAAILGQAGRPVRVWRGGAWRSLPGWGGTRRIGMPSLDSRLASVVGVPDLALFPARYGARSVLFRAGLELGLLHRGLGLAALAVRAGLLPSLRPLVGPALWVAGRLEGAGTDRGGMLVEVTGRDAEGRPLLRRWSLVAEAGDGPFIPTIPALILIGKAARGALAPGARACLGEFSLAEAEAALARLQVRCRREERPAPRLFEAVLREDWQRLPAAVRRLHDIWDLETFAGQATVERGSGPLAKALGLLFRFPPASTSTPVAVEIRREGEREVWTRRFGDGTGRRFRSVLSGGGAGRFDERFGPLRCRIALAIDDKGLRFPVEKAWLFGLPLPRSLLPRSDSCEYQDEDGRFRFDVALSAPLAGPVVRYRGFLVPEAREAASALLPMAARLDGTPESG